MLHLIALLFPVALAADPAEVPSPADDIADIDMEAPLEDPQPAHVLVQQSRQEWLEERTAEGLERFFVDGDTTYLRRMVPMNPWMGGSTLLSREVHWEEETVTYGGVPSHWSSGVETWTVSTISADGEVHVETRQVGLGENPPYLPDAP